MADRFCPQCGAVVEEGASECRYCRAKMGDTSPVYSNQSYYQQEPADDAANNKVYAIFAYFGILVLIPILAAPNSKFARFHANQGLVLFVAEMILSVITFVSGGMWIVRILVNIGRIFALVLSILGIVAAAQGEEKELPVIGSIHLLK